MSAKEVSFDSIRNLCLAREVDLLLCSAPHPFQICIKGRFDGYGHFFSILVQDVEYVELAGTLTVGDLLLSDVPAMVGIAPKWEQLDAEYSGPALALRSADTEDWKGAASEHLYLVIANHMQFRAGPDWDKAHDGT